MHRSIHIKNFRAFENFSTDAFERVNLITGMNCSGKTSLLEAIFLTLGPTNPALPTIIQGIRGYNRFESVGEEIWGWLFYRKDSRLRISIEVARDDLPVRRVDLSLSLGQHHLQDAGQETIAGLGVSDSEHSIPRHLVMTLEPEGIVTRAYLKDGGLKYDSTEGPTFPPGLFMSSSHSGQQDDVKRFSKLLESKHQAPVVDAVSLLNPSICALSILLLGGVPTVCAEVVGMDALVPLQFLGEGVKRVMAIITSIVSAPGGYVLIDEIENGIHHSVLRDVWRAIDRASRENNVQIFATTHSWECVRAAHEVFSEDEDYPFGLQRLDIVEGRIVAKRYTRETLDIALQSELEVR